MLQLYNGTSYVNRFELGNSSENVWNQYTVTINATAEPAFFRTNFRIRVAGAGIDTGERLWVDDVQITAP
jgi:hypothetical protein